MVKVIRNKIKTKKFCGNYGWLWFWIIVFFPVAIIYWACKQIEMDVKVKKKKYDWFKGNIWVFNVLIFLGLVMLASDVTIGLIFLLSGFVYFFYNNQILRDSLKKRFV